MAASINIVLFEPEIPHNTGAIGRLCVGLNAALHLIEPLGFHIHAEAVRRAGLDYWPHLDLHVHRHWQAFLEAARPAPLHLFSTRGRLDLFATAFRAPCWLVFGSESRGFPAWMHERHGEAMIRIPMPGSHARSLNLANAAAVVAYEAYRQFSATTAPG